jgi:DNA-binding NarL/FixJ family response regulator
VLIVDDHTVVRSGLRALLNVPGVDVCGEAATGAEAVQLTPELGPDVVLMDVRMPDMDGLTATRLIKRHSPGVAIVIVTSFESQEYLREAIEAGAAGYLLKGMSRELLLSTLRSASDGGSMVDATMLRQLVQRSPRPASPTGVLDTLSDRELKTVQLVARGQTNREIAAQLGYSVGTIKNVVQQLIEKLGASDRTQAAVVAVREGLEVD